MKQVKDEKIVITNVGKIIAKTNKWIINCVNEIYAKQQFTIL